MMVMIMVRAKVVAVIEHFRRAAAAGGAHK
jgi:hypothetical protein